MGASAGDIPKVLSGPVAPASPMASTSTARNAFSQGPAKLAREIRKRALAQDGFEYWLGGNEGAPKPRVGQSRGKRPMGRINSSNSVARDAHTESLDDVLTPTTGLIALHITNPATAHTLETMGAPVLEYLAAACDEGFDKAFVVCSGFRPQFDIETANVDITYIDATTPNINAVLAFYADLLPDSLINTFVISDDPIIADAARDFCNNSTWSVSCETAVATNAARVLKYVGGLGAHIEQLDQDQ